MTGIVTIFEIYLSFIIEDSLNQKFFLKLLTFFLIEFNDDHHIH